LILFFNQPVRRRLLEREMNKRDKQTVATPDRDAVQRQRKQRNTPAAAEQDEGVAGSGKCGVATRANQRAHDAEQEATKMTCFDFRCDRYSTWKSYGVLFCNQCDQYGSLAPEKKTKKRRSAKKFWCTVYGHKDGMQVKKEASWLATHYQLKAPPPDYSELSFGS
jgi:hypothetical protein